VTTNDKHLEKQEAKSGDHLLAGAQITKAEDSAVKQRQEQLDGLKSHRITKDGNAFTIDMGGGDTVQDVRAGKAVAEKPAQGILPGEGDYMPKTDGTLPTLPGKSDIPLPGPVPDDHGRTPEWNPHGKSDVPIPGFPPPGQPDFPVPDDHGRTPEWNPREKPDVPLPGRIPEMPDIPLPGKSDFPMPGDLSKLTLKTDTTIDKQGHIVTTETHADGSTLATTQEIGSDSKLHVVSTQEKDVNGDTTVSKFDSVTGKKTEEIKDTSGELIDTKYNTNGQPEIKDTTSKLTGQTDHEQWVYEPANGACLWHFKNGKAVEDVPQFIDGAQHSGGAQERGDLPIVDAVNAAYKAGHDAWNKYADKYFLTDWNGPHGHQHYDTAKYQWLNDKGDRVKAPPLSAYVHKSSGNWAEDAKYNAIHRIQQLCDDFSDDVAGIGKK
jgi:hypothetical protein